MMKVVIDRSMWYRGLGDSGSALRRRSDGKMCCLGFVGIACGYTPEQISGMSTPDDVLNFGQGHVRAPAETSKWPEALAAKTMFDNGWGDTALTNSLITVNDSLTMGDDEREKRIGNLLASAGVEVEFVGEDWRSPEAVEKAKNESAY